jgi:hypothetical protein
LRRLRRGHCAANAVRRDRFQIRRPMGHRRSHRLQHRLHVNVSI